MIKWQSIKDSQPSGVALFLDKAGLVSIGEPNGGGFYDLWRHCFISATHWAPIGPYKINQPESSNERV